MFSGLADNIVILFWRRPRRPMCTMKMVVIVLGLFLLSLALVGWGVVIRISVHNTTFFQGDHCYWLTLTGLLYYVKDCRKFAYMYHSIYTMPL
jgi:heme A synthase